MQYSFSNKVIKPNKMNKKKSEDKIKKAKK